MLFRFVLIILTFLIAQHTQARTLNQDLRSQIDQDPNRVLPQGDSWSLAGDLQIYWHIDKNENDFYHSGYWLNLFSEYRPLDRLAINLKLATVNPSNSYGYNSPALIIPFLSASYFDTFFDGDVKVSARGGDLDRQTLGAGLLASEKEMSGLYLEALVYDFRASFIKPGTGVFNEPGDADILRLDWHNHLLGIYIFDATVPEQESFQTNNGSYQSLATGDKAKMETLYFNGFYSQWQHSSGLFYLTEFAVGGRQKKHGHLERVGYKFDSAEVAGSLWLENRFYQHQFFDGITGRVDQDYVTIEDRDKEYLNPMNIAPIADHANLHAAGLKATLFKSRMVRLSERSEVLAWKDISTFKHPLYIFEHGILYCPWAGKDSFMKLAYSNIIANVNGLPNRNSLGNQTFLRLQNHFRVEAGTFF